MNPGDTVTLMTSDLFDVMDGYTASYGVSVEGDSASASASGESVTINALMAGEAKITVTGTARMASSSLIPTQTVSNVAELTFPVMVVDTELVVTLSAEPMEIEAGGTTMITATANRYVTAGDGAVEIALTVVGDGTLDPESITIAMGDMSGSAMLTANESVTVVATGQRRQRPHAGRGDRDRRAGAGASAVVDCAVAARSWPDGWRRTGSCIGGGVRASRAHRS